MVVFIQKKLWIYYMILNLWIKKVEYYFICIILSVLFYVNFKNKIIWIDRNTSLTKISMLNRYDDIVLIKNNNIERNKYKKINTIKINQMIIYSVVLSYWKH